MEITKTNRIFFLVFALIAIGGIMVLNRIHEMEQDFQRVMQVLEPSTTRLTESTVSTGSASTAKVSTASSTAEASTTSTIDYQSLVNHALKNQTDFVLDRLTSAIRNAWNVPNYSDDRRILSKRLNRLFMELNQFICELRDVVSTVE